MVRFKNSLSDEEEFKEVKFLKKNRNESNMENFKLNVLYKARRPISTKKRKFTRNCRFTTGICQ